MLKQTSKNGGKCTLIGGALNNRELPKKALIRESKEEAGIKLFSDDLQLVHTLFKQKADDLRIVMYFKATKWEGRIQSREPKKFKKVSWLPLAKLPKNTSPTVRHVLKQYQMGVPYSEFNG